MESTKSKIIKSFSQPQSDSTTCVMTAVPQITELIDAQLEEFERYRPVTPCAVHEEIDEFECMGIISLRGLRGSNQMEGEERISGKAWGRARKFVTEWDKYPKGVFFIVGNEFCERFSYYGMRAILVMYLTDWLLFGKNTATAIFHCFAALSYFSPIFGAILADGYIGKYRTILYISIMYAVGNIVMSLTALPPPYWLGPAIGLLLIGFATGGIKPCVSAFGGDQFTSDQEKQLYQFFSVFYFAINLGSVLSMVMIPNIRSYVYCFGTNCYPLAFGIPAILMIISLVIFFLGRSMYKKFPPTGNVIGQMVRCIAYALKQRWKSDEKRSSWLDHADDKFESAFIEDVKCVLRVFVLLLPLPIFWSLFDQQGSRWTLQAKAMDKYLFGFWHLPPDLIQALNPIFIILFIPLFETLIYPAISKCGVPYRPLQRMAAGMLLAAVAFVVAGIVQIQIDGKADNLVAEADKSALRFINSASCPLQVQSPLVNNSLDAFQATDNLQVESGKYTAKFTAQNQFNASCPSLAETSKSLTLNMMPSKAYYVIIAPQQNKLDALVVTYHNQKPTEAGGLVSFVYAADVLPEKVTLTADLLDNPRKYVINLNGFNSTAFQEMEAGSYNLMAEYNTTTNVNVSGQMVVKNGGLYTVVVQENINRPNTLQFVTYVDVHPNHVTILLQIPQYIIITCGEILFSVSGLQFAYSQAPPSMKSVVQAAWLMTVAIGNMVDVIIAGGGMIADQATEFFVFAGLMVVTTIIFSILGYFYKYVTPQTQDSTDRTRLTDLSPDDQAEDELQPTTYQSNMDSTHKDD